MTVFYQVIYMWAMKANKIDILKFAIQTPQLLMYFLNVLLMDFHHWFFFCTL